MLCLLLKELNTAVTFLQVYASNLGIRCHVSGAAGPRINLLGVSALKLRMFGFLKAGKTDRMIDPRGYILVFITHFPQSAISDESS